MRRVEAQPNIIKNDKCNDVQLDVSNGKHAKCSSWTTLSDITSVEEALLILQVETRREGGRLVFVRAAVRASSMVI